MAYLGKYIRQILSEKENVTLPGFGSLVAREGKGVSGEKGIEPPGIVVSFDAEHPLDDGKLAEAYSRGEQLEPEEARQQVLELVDAIKFRLDKGEKYVLEGVGEFSRDQDNRIRFKKDPGWVIDPDLFGLSTVDLLELEDATEENQSGTDEVVEKSEPAVSNEKAGEPVRGVQPRKRQSVHRAPVNKWRIIWIVVGSLIVVLVLLLLIPGNQQMEFGREGIIFKDSDQVEATGEPVTETPAASGEVVQGTGTGEGGTEGPGEVKEEQAAPSEVQAEEDGFHIIAGSFQGLQNASDLQDRLKVQGFPARIIITENRMYRVSVRSYASKQEAIDDLQRVRNETGLQGCWVLTR